MPYNGRKQLEYNNWIDQGTARKEGSDKNILINYCNASSFQDKNDDKTPEEDEAIRKGFVRRRNLGKKGNPITVTINYVTISFTDPKAIIFHYNVRVEPEPSDHKLYRKLFEITQAEKFPHAICAFNGRNNLYTRKPISAYGKDTRISESVNIFAEQNTFKTIKRFNSIENSNWLPTLLQFKSSSYKECKTISGKISAFNTVSLWDEDILAKRSFKIYTQLNEVVRNDATNSWGASKKVVEAMETIIGENALKKCQEWKLTQSGDIVFARYAEPVGQIDEGLNLHFGFRQMIVKNLTLLHHDLFIAIDMTYGCFYDTLPVIDFISLICNKPKCSLRDSPLEAWEIEVIKNDLKGIRVIYKDPGYAMPSREHIVSDVAASADTIRYEMGLLDFFNDHSRFYPLKKSYDLEFPNIPFLVVGPPGLRLGLPPELCTIAPGQVFNKRMTQQQKESLKELLLDLKPEPRQIKNEIIKLVTALGVENNELFSQFNIQINKNLLQTNGRVLKPPVLICKSAMFSGVKQISPSKSSWDVEHFENAVSIDNWAICNVDQTEEPDLLFLATALRFRGMRLGMKMEEPQLYSKVVQNEEDFEKYFEIFLRDRKSENCEVVLVVIPSSGMFYGKIKQIAELQVGMLTQCLKSSTVKRLDLSIMNDLLLKLNAKLNGNGYNVKSALWPKYFIRPVLVVGVYVNINEPKKNPSFPFIASIVGNYNKHATKHNVIWSFLKSDSDHIGNLDKIIGELITRYWRESGAYPEKILYYRDGISEDNMWMVMEKEAELIRDGCAALHPFYQPSLTFIEVNRTHPAMFLPNKQTEIPAGTVVDSTIVHPNQMEFYLMSHLSYLGTPRPTKYHVLMDESHLSEDDIQEITFYLCHLSCRCTRSVPMPVQLYYARLATQRAQKYFDRSFVDDEELDKTMKDILNVSSLLQGNPMFFV